MDFDSEAPPFSVILVIVCGCGKEVERSYVCSSSLADRLGAPPSRSVIASCDRRASDKSGDLTDPGCLLPPSRDHGAG
jgi:hypothetical protein